MLITIPALAQNEGDVEESPAVEAQQDEQPATQQSQPETAPPVEQDDTAENQSPGEDSNYYARNDLVAQQRMADATEKLVDLSGWQIGIVSIETVLLIATVIFTGIATRAASRAARAAETAVAAGDRHAEIQLRAYVLSDSHTIEMRPDRTFHIDIFLSNTGQTPAHGFEAWVMAAIASNPLPKQGLPIYKPNPEWSSRGSFGAGGKIHLEVTSDKPIDQPVIDRIGEGKMAVYVHGEAIYRDVFGEPRPTKFRLMYAGPWGGTKRMTYCADGNEAT